MKSQSYYFWVTFVVASALLVALLSQSFIATATGENKNVEAQSSPIQSLRLLNKKNKKQRQKDNISKVQVDDIYQGEVIEDEVVGDEVTEAQDGYDDEKKARKKAKEGNDNIEDTSSSLLMPSSFNIPLGKDDESMVRFSTALAKGNDGEKVKQSKSSKKNGTKSPSHESRTKTKSPSHYDKTKSPSHVDDKREKPTDTKRDDNEDQKTNGGYITETSEEEDEVVNNPVNSPAPKPPPIYYVPPEDMKKKKQQMKLTQAQQLRDTFILSGDETAYDIDSSLGNDGQPMLAMMEQKQSSFVNTFNPYYPDLDSKTCLSDGKHSEWQVHLYDSLNECVSYCHPTCVF